MLAVALSGLLAAGAAGCGGGERQDADEPDRSFDMSIVSAKFPERQRLAQTSELAITVRNDDDETVPNAAITLDGLSTRSKYPGLADPDRPVFVIDGDPAEIGGFQEVKLAAPQGGQTALLNTWTVGAIEPNAEKTFRWRVTAVKAGPFEIDYALAASLGGKAKAVATGGDDQPQGSFKGTVTSKPPPSRIAADGHTVVNPAP